MERAVPDIWTLAEPETFLTARAASAAAALRRVAPAIEQLADNELMSMLEVVAVAAAPGGRPLYAANRATPVRHDPVERLWQTCTTLREQRGDGHVAALVGAGLAAPQADRLRIAETGEPAELLLANRGWTDHAWAEAESSLQQQGLIDGHGITTQGAAVRANIERVTDTLAASALAELATDQRRSLLRLLTPVVRTIANSNLIPYPNPIGLTRALG